MLVCLCDMRAASSVSWDSGFIVVWAWWKSGGKLLSFFLVHLLFNCQQRWILCWFCLVEKLQRTALGWSAAPCQDLIGRCKTSPLLCQGAQITFKVAPALTVFGPLLSLYISQRSRRTSHHFKEIRYSATLPLSLCPLAVLMLPSVVINFWLEQSVTVSKFQDNWQDLVPQVRRACLRSRTHWTVKLSEWFASGSTDWEGWDDRWRSNRKSCIHLNYQRYADATRCRESMFRIYQSHPFGVITKKKS